MDEQFDNELKNHIKEVFENFDDASADEGWLELRKKYPEEVRRHPVIWMWWGAAAAILLIFFGLWIYSESGKPQKIAQRPLKPTRTARDLAAVKSNNDKAGQIKPANDPNVTAPAKKGSTVINPYAGTVLASSAKRNQAQAAPTLFLNDTIAKRTLAAKNSPDFKAPDKITPEQQLAATVLPNPVPVQKNVSKTDSVAVAPQSSAKSMSTMLAEEHIVKNQKSAEKYKDGSKRIRFGIYATTYFNYAKGSNNRVNGGAGFSSDISISKNLKLVTGIAIIENTLNYNNNGFTNGSGLASATTPPAVADFYFASAGATGANVPKVASYAIVAVPTFKNYNASLVGLDIPLNIKYEFNPKKNDLYVLAGVSSGTFVNETYTYQYNSPSFFSASAHKTLGETTAKSFNSFYLAKTLNVAFGVGYPFGRHRLVIEPFLKYPLEGLGSQQIRFGAGGVNLKFNFESLHK